MFFISVPYVNFKDYTHAAAGIWHAVIASTATIREGEVRRPEVVPIKSLPMISTIGLLPLSTKFCYLLTVWTKFQWQAYGAQTGCLIFGVRAGLGGLIRTNRNLDPTFLIDFYYTHHRLILHRLQGAVYFCPRQKHRRTAARNSSRNATLYFGCPLYTSYRLKKHETVHDKCVRGM